jgi:hypothetical protein
MKAQCEGLQSIVNNALLPKLHVNRKTACCIIHGPEELGGMSLPYLYSSRFR